MKRSNMAVLVVLVVLVLFPLMAWGQQKGAVELTSIAEVEVVQKNEKGKEEPKRVEASKANVAPGETVIFTVQYVNKGDKPAENVVINNPVPRHMDYIEKSAEGKDTKIDFSVDGGRTFGAPDKLRVKGADGKERTALASEYTHIRWVLLKPIPAGEKGSVSFLAKVK